MRCVIHASHRVLARYSRCIGYDSGGGLCVASHSCHPWSLVLRYTPLACAARRPVIAYVFFLSSPPAQVLSDQEKRPIYDLDGVEGLERHEKGGNQAASPFDMFFGGGGGGGRRKGPDAQVEMEVTLEDLYNGGQRAARINRNIICPKCRGTGAKDGDVRNTYLRIHTPAQALYIVLSSFPSSLQSSTSPRYPACLTRHYSL